MKKRNLFCMGVLLFLFLAGGVKGDDVNDLKQQLKEQNELLLKMQQRLEQLEAKQTTQEQTIEKKISEVAEKKQTFALPENVKWIENVKFYGDLRYRHESIDQESNGSQQPSNNRHRIRARLGLTAKINDEWDLGLRIATGSSGDPTSTNQTLENGFAKKSIWLDLAYFDYHPKAVKGLNVLGGKMPNPFYRVGENQLVWDGDVNPEGIAAKYVRSLTKSDKLYINGGGFWLEADDGSGVNDGEALWAAQTYLKHEFENKNHLLGGLSYYMFGNVRGKPVFFNKPLGNTTTGGSYTMNYNVVEGFAEYGFKAFDLPSTVYGSYIKNTDAATSKDSAWVVGTTFNNAKDPGTWQLGYNYRVVQNDATLGTFTDSDFIGGGTNGKGHELSGKYQLTKNVQLGLTYIIAQRGANDDDYRRLMADIIFKF